METPTSAVLINPPASDLGRVNAVLNAKGRRHSVHNFPGPLSIKAVMRGSARWRTDDGEFFVDETSLLVLNHGQPYSLEVASRTPVETCCLFFRPGFVESVYRSRVASHDELLDDPQPGASLPPTFPPGLIFEGQPLLARVRRIHRELSFGALRASAPGPVASTWLETEVLLAANELVEVNSRLQREAARVPRARAATRSETYKRLRRARDFMHGHCGEPLSLSEIARAASLSTYHFHRLFTKTFHERPHEYLTRLRLDRACRLLRRDDLSVTEVCLDSGFESLGSFSALFHRRTGLSPSQFRRRAENSKIEEEPCPRF